MSGGRSGGSGEEGAGRVGVGGAEGGEVAVGEDVVYERKNK